MVFEADSGSLTDLFIDAGHGDKAEDCEAIVGGPRLPKVSLGAVARLMRWREGVKKTLERNCRVSGFHLCRES